VALSAGWCLIPHHLPLHCPGEGLLITSNIPSHNEAEVQFFRCMPLRSWWDFSTRSGKAGVWVYRRLPECCQAPSRVAAALSTYLPAVPKSPTAPPAPGEFSQLNGCQMVSGFILHSIPDGFEPFHPQFSSTASVLSMGSHATSIFPAPRGWGHSCTPERETEALRGWVPHFSPPLPSPSLGHGSLAH
jgi:hypothetical protein